MSIDRMDWHYGADNFPTDLPEENGGTHIGMFLAWVISNDLASEFLLTECHDGILDLKARRITGREFLINECDEKFWEEELSEQGLAFTESYYTEYMSDFETVLASNLPSAYHVEDSWENYNLIASVISSRFEKWKNKKKPRKWLPF